MDIKIPANKTKIVCTIGPASRSQTMIHKMIRSGMNVARLNFSHGEMDQHIEDIKTIRQVARQMGVPIAILADLPGPKIRVGMIENNAMDLKNGEVVVLTTRDNPSPRQIPVQYKEITRHVAKGSRIYLNDGFIQLRVLSLREKDIQCRVIIGGRLLSHKGINLPDSCLDVEPVTDRDLEFVRFGLENTIDIFSVSFASGPQDIIKIKDYITKHRGSAHVLAKIERKEALNNIDALLEVSDAIMVARGDLGVEIPLEKVPGVQKKIIFKANLAGCPVITATQMLESMTENIRPTRAEVTDVANAILDGTDAVMLSEETAIGRYPADAVKTMRKIARETEKIRSNIPGNAGVSQEMRSSLTRRQVSTGDALSIDIVEAINALNIRYVLTETLGGKTPRRISRYKSSAWILAFCHDIACLNLLVLSYGVLPVLTKKRMKDDDLVSFVRDKGLVRPGWHILITNRFTDGPHGKTHSLNIVTLS
ncbi:MAG: pyruvate kinase [Thermodesulfobacteriota bacterium]|nr:pyruvate kinase [Thermodesulfobacteriota bacterium]